jgi:hypothetical protein
MSVIGGKGVSRAVPEPEYGYKGPRVAGPRPPGQTPNASSATECCVGWLVASRTARGGGGGVHRGTAEDGADGWKFVRVARTGKTAGGTKV